MADKQTTIKKRKTKRKLKPIEIALIVVSVLLAAVTITFGTLAGVYADELGALASGERLYTADELNNGGRFVTPSEKLRSGANVGDIYINTKLSDLEYLLIANSDISVPILYGDGTRYGELTVVFEMSGVGNNVTLIALATGYHEYSIIYASADYAQTSNDTTKLIKKGWQAQYIDEATGKFMLDFPVGARFGNWNFSKELALNYVFAASSFISEA